MSVTGPHFGLSVDVQRDASPQGAYFWQGHPWPAQLRHPCLIKPSEHQQADQIASTSFPHLGEKKQEPKNKRLNSGMTAMDGGNASERQDDGVVHIFEMWVENIVLQNFLE